MPLNKKPNQTKILPDKQPKGPSEKRQTKGYLEFSSKKKKKKKKKKPFHQNLTKSTFS